VCDRVTLIDRGQVLATESPAALSLLLSRHERIECVGAAASVLEDLGALACVAGVTVTAESARIELATDAAVGEVMRRLVAAGVTSVKVTRPSLEEVYLGMVGDRGMGI
jgi:ABC-2 type transport system ATP-binding protein